MVAAEVSHSEAESLADQIMIGLLTQLAAQRYKDSDPGKKIFSAIREFAEAAFKDPDEKRVFQERIDYYADRWQQGGRQ